MLTRHVAMSLRNLRIRNWILFNLNPVDGATTACGTTIEINVINFPNSIINSTIRVIQQEPHSRRPVI